VKLSTSSLIAVGSLMIAAASTSANAQVTFEIIGAGGATDISSDGTVIVGNTNDVYETFYWTAETGILPLGRATVPAIGVGAGVPEVSSDGTRISATILTDDGMYATQGVWDINTGWQQCIPPVPPDGGLLDNSYGSSWGISGDGTTVVGLYWRPGQPGGSAHPSQWTQSGGLVDLGTQGGSGRANGVSFDGSVIVGWIENPNFGNWWPTVWVNGVRTVLKETEGFAEANAVSPDGAIVVGSSWFLPIGPFSVEEAAIWRWNGTEWAEQRIGKLPGTASPFGIAVANGVTADGSMVVGYNRFSHPGNATGFVWTEAGGLVDVAAYLAANGVTIPADFDILNLSAIADDGSVLVGNGQDLIEPYTARSFRIDRCALRGDVNKDAVVDGADIAGFVRAKLGEPALAGENQLCAIYGGTLVDDVAAFTADLLGN